MARGDGIDRTNARNMRLTETKIGNTQQHNEREKDSYVNQDIVLERTPLNVHFKTPSAGYREMFARMEADGVISTRGIKEDAFRYGELVFDVILHCPKWNLPIEYWEILPSIQISTFPLFHSFLTSLIKFATNN